MGATRLPSRRWRYAIVAALALWLLAPASAFACEPVPLNCSVVFAPTGRPLELRIGVGPCHYDTHNYAISVWVTLTDPNGLSGATLGTSELGPLSLLVPLEVHKQHSGGRYVLTVKVSVGYTGRSVPIQCYNPGSWSFSANVPGAAATPKPTPRPTPRPTPKPTHRPTPKPTHRPTPKPTAKAAPTAIPAALIPTLLSPGPAASPPGQAVASSAASETFPPIAGGPTDKGGIPGEAPVVQIGLIVAVAAISLIGLFIVTTGHRARATAGQPWVCPACSSINGKGRTRCYGCSRKLEA